MRDGRGRHPGDHRLGVNGLLSPAGDANALAANLMTLESDEGLRRRMAFRAAETAQRFQRDHRYGDAFAAALGLSSPIS